MKHFKLKLLLIASIILLFYTTKALTNHLDSTLIDFAQTYGENAICEILNQCISETVQNLSAEYDSICKIHHASDGKITAITFEAESINKLKAETVSAIIRYIKDKKESFHIPLGTLLGSRIFSSRGPEIQIKIIPLGAVSSSLNQQFKSVGINQTLHSLYLDVRISVKIASPFSSTNIDVYTNVCIAQTVIIGDIPLAFLD